MQINLIHHHLLNAVFETNHHNRFENQLTLIFDTVRMDDPQATIVILHNIHPILGEYVERQLKRDDRLGYKRRAKLGALRTQQFDGKEWITIVEY